MPIRNKFIFIILAIEIANIVYFSLFFYFNKYLPAPFVWDKNDTFMDFYNPLFWIIKDEFYTTYKSVYPPINYFFLKLFTFNLDSNSFSSSFQLREAKSNLIYYYSAINAFIIFLILKIGDWREVSSGCRIFIWAAIIFSVPVLFAIERGNLIFVSLLVLAIYIATENIWVKAITFALLVNLKPYFIILLIEYLNIYKFDLKIISKFIITSTLMFLLTSLAAGLDIIAFISNYNNFGSRANFSNDGLLALPNTLESIAQFIKLIFKNKEDAHLSEILILPLKLLKVFVPLTFILLVLAMPLEKRTLKVSAILLIGNFSHVTSGYIYLIYILIVPFLLREVELRKGIYLMLIIFVLPLDWVRVPSFINYYTFMQSYLGGVEIYNVDFWLSIGTLVRPISNFTLMCLMINYILKNKNA
jgi:hypothetical protein